MKDAEDEAFDDLAKRQGMWGGGFQAKRRMVADKLQEPWANLTEQEWLNLGCSSVEEVRIGLAIQAKLKEKNT
jgi:hypothetical protein